MIDFAESQDKALTEAPPDSNDLFIGLDLGTSQSAIATSTGRLYNIPSVVGFPVDFVAQKLLKKPVVFGNECLRNRLSVDMLFPLEKGVIVRKSGTGAAQKEDEAARELIKYLLSRIDRKDDQKVFLVVGAPAQATLEDKQAVRDAVSGLVDSVLIVSEPFLVAYGLGLYGFAIIVDIGAGTLDVCRMHGTLPDEGDQKTLDKAGNYIDQVLFDMLKMKMPNARITLDIARKIKEKYAFVDKKFKAVSHEFYISGKPVKYEITHEVKEASVSVLSDMLQTIRELVVSFEQEYQQNLLDNIVLAGCGSRIGDLEQTVKNELSNLGDVNVCLVDDPVYAGAIGGLKLAQDVPLEEWEKI